MDIYEAYQNWADTYDSETNFTRDLDRLVTRETLRNLHFGAALEIGCGTGKNSSLLAHISQTVYALDFSEGMINLARENVDADNICFILADVTREWPCNTHSVDLVTCNLVLEHIENLSFIFTEAHRVLAETGRLFISELHPFRQYLGKKARFERNGRTHTIPAFVHHISDFTGAAQHAGFHLIALREWWHPDEKQTEPPRIVSFLFRKDRG